MSADAAYTSARGIPLRAAYRMIPKIIMAYSEIYLRIKKCFPDHGRIGALERARPGPW